MTHPVLLAIECSQRCGGVALQDRAGRIHERRFETGARRDDVLQPTIESLFRDCDLVPGDLEGCGCSIGPGGFTGLRITVATARALGMALGVPLYGIPSAMVAAASSSTGGHLLVAGVQGGDAVAHRFDPDGRRHLVRLGFVGRSGVGGAGSARGRCPARR